MSTPAPILPIAAESGERGGLAAMLERRGHAVTQVDQAAQARAVLVERSDAGLVIVLALARPEALRFLRAPIMGRPRRRARSGLSDGEIAVMAVRIAFDMDGVLADFSTAFSEVEQRLFGDSSSVAVEAPEVEARHEEEVVARPPAHRRTPREMRRRRDAIWDAIHKTPDFWTTLKPLDGTAVRRVHSMMLRYGWEVFFITQRPSTVGRTVQRQTQQWLHLQGFDLPSVLVISGSRGAAAGALRLNFHVDDSPQNCLDVASESRARPILIVPERDDMTESSAKRLRIGIARSIGDALDGLEEIASSSDVPRPLLRKLSKIVGWD